MPYSQESIDGCVQVFPYQRLPLHLIIRIIQINLNRLQKFRPAANC